MRKGAAPWMVGALRMFGSDGEAVKRSDGRAVERSNGEAVMPRQDATFSASVLPDGCPAGACGADFCAAAGAGSGRAAS